MSDMDYEVFPVHTGVNRSQLGFAVAHTSSSPCTRG